MKKLVLFGALFMGTTAFGQVLTENFDAVTAPGLPAGWTTSNGNGGDVFETGINTDANAGGYWPVPAHGQFAMANDDVCNCTMAAVYLTSPSMDFTGMSGMGLTYSVVDDGSYGGNPHKVEVSVDGGSTWTAVYTHSFSGLTWETVTVSLGAAADNQADVRFRIKYDDGGAWATGVAIDDIVVDALPALEVVMNSVSLARYAATSTNSTLSFNVSNVGANAITSLEVNWNDGTDHIQTIAVSIPSGGSANVNHPTSVNYATAVEKNINVTITAVNGGADGDPSNNAGSALHNTVSQIVPKNVVIEEGTGTWCGWCPRGAVSMDYMYTTYPDRFIGIAVHNGDPMTVAAYDAAADFGGYPMCNVDRVLLDQSVSQAAFETYYNQRVNLTIPAGISIDISGTGSNAIIDVSSTFYTPFAAANQRLAVIIIEDNVTGTTDGYNQVNYYAGGANGVMGGYELLPNPVPAAQMVYNHVGRALLGGYTGQTGSIPTSITDGQVVNYTFNYTIPSTSVRANMYAVALLIDQTTGEIITAEKESLSLTSINEMDAVNLSIYPNPATDMVHISFDCNGSDYFVSLTDNLGREIRNGSYKNLTGKQTISFSTHSLDRGSYFVNIHSAGDVISLPLILN